MLKRGVFFLLLVNLLVAFVLCGCSDEGPVIDEGEYGHLKLPANIRNLAASPDGCYLLFSVTDTLPEQCCIINTQTYEGEFCETRKTYWGELEALTTPGMEQAGVSITDMTPEGKVLYTGYEYGPDMSNNASIYFSELGLPPEVYHQIDLGAGEAVSGMRPVWQANQEDIYYITAQGVMSYCMAEEQSTLIIPSSELAGLIKENGLSPHAFNIGEGKAELAYYDQGEIMLVTLETGDPELEVIETGITDISNVSFIFGGKYIVLESAYMREFAGYWLEFLDRETGELVEVGKDYLPPERLSNDRDELVFVEYREEGDYKFNLVNSNLGVEDSIAAPREGVLNHSVIRVDSDWYIVEWRQEFTLLKRIVEF